MQAAMVLNICNAFKEIPQWPKTMPFASGGRAKHQNSTEVPGNNPGVKEQKRRRALREEEFLRKLWQLLSPSKSEEGHDNSTQGECIPVRVMTDYLKLIYDPYISGISLNADAFDQKVELTVGYVREIRRILSLNDSSPAESEEDLEPLVKWLILELRDLTDNYLTFRIASKGLKIPSTRDVKVW